MVIVKNDNGKGDNKRQHWKTRNELVTTSSNYENIVYSSRAHHQNMEENNIKLTQEKFSNQPNHRTRYTCSHQNQQMAAGKPFTN